MPKSGFILISMRIAKIRMPGLAMTAEASAYEWI